MYEPSRTNALCLLISGVDNPRPDTARRTQHLLYSPDLAPSGFHLVVNVKKWLGSQRFGNDDEQLHDAVTGWLRSQAVEFYEEGISIVIKRYNKCLNLNGDCVEK